jgi:hypothetical protein
MKSRLGKVRIHSDKHDVRKGGRPPVCKICGKPIVQGEHTIQLQDLCGKLHMECSLKLAEEINKHWWKRGETEEAKQVKKPKR